MLTIRPLVEATAWYFATAFFLLLPPPIAVIYVVVCLGAFSWRLLLRPAARSAPYGDVGLRPIGPSFLWVGAAILTAVVLYFAFFTAVAHLVSLEELQIEMWRRYAARPFGGVPMGLVVVLGAGLIEEFTFRGVVQHALTRRFGPATGLVVAALLFAFVHFHPSAFHDYLLVGAMAGLLVHRTRSLWAGIALHTTINASLLTAAALPGLSAYAQDPSAAPLRWSLIALIASTLVFVALLTRIKSAPIVTPLTIVPSARDATDGPPVALP